VRGRLRNRPADDIVAEINSLVEHGYREVVLTGVHLGHYKNRTVEPQMKNLAALSRYIFEKTTVARIRLSSLEPQTVREDLVGVYAEANGRICRHMHLPLQSGSSRILRLMLRPYDQNTYIRRVTALREAQPNTIIGADVIVGFPGETDEDFQQSRRLAESASSITCMSSVIRSCGTKASAMTDKVPPEIIKERNAILTEVSGRLYANALRRQAGETLDVIAEHKREADGSFYGVSDNYLKVKLPSDTEGGKRLIRVRVTDSTDHHLLADIIG